MKYHGVTIEQGLNDWQVLQHKNGVAEIMLRGSWQLPEGEDAEDCTVVVRLLREEDNQQVIPWQNAVTTKTGNKTGSWHLAFTLPAGGPYRLETGMDTGSDKSKTWVLRGDLCLHVCVGNLFVIAGQSNAAGYGRDSAFDPPQRGVHFYRNCGKWDLAVHPLNEVTGQWDVPNAEHANSGVSPYVSFGRMFQKLSGLPVGLVPTSLGGSPIKKWVKRLEGDLYENMLQRIESAGGSVAGVLWYQGCSDTDTQEQTDSYFKNFAEMVGDLRASLGETVPIFTFQLNRYPFGAACEQRCEHWSNVKEAQRKAANALDAVYILPTMDCMMCDQIHNSAGANVLLGERLARQCGHVLCGTQPFFAPDILSAVANDKRLLLQISNITFGFECFNLPLKTWFTIKDGQGCVEICGGDVDKDTIAIELAHPLDGEATVSFATGCNPTQPVLCDNITYLPLLSFYEFPIKQENNLN